MANAVTTTSPLYSTPYLTVAEYKQAPTAIDVDDLVGGGSQALNDAELSNVVARASSWIDTVCGQVLSATNDTEHGRARISRDGALRIHPRYWPVLEVTGFFYGVTPNALVTLTDVSGAWIEPMEILIPLQGLGTSFLGQLGFSSPRLGAEAFYRLIYVNGYPNATLATASVAGAATLTLSEVTGILPGSRFTVYDADFTETVTVASTWVPTSGQATVPLVGVTSKAHYAPGVACSALPPAVKQAAIYVTSAILKARGSASLVMDSITPGGSANGYPGGSATDMAMARELLAPYRRMR